MITEDRDGGAEIVSHREATVDVAVRHVVGAAALAALTTLLVVDARRQSRARARLQSRRIRLADGTSVSSLTGGSAQAPPIVLVPGFGVSSAYMVPLASALARHWHVHVVELRGHGTAPSPPGWMKTGVLELHIQTVYAYVRSHQFRSVCLLGHSFGAQIAAHAAQRLPETTELVLIGPTADVRARSPLRHMARLALSALGERPLLDLIVLRDYLGTPPRQLWAELRAMLGDDLRDTLQRLRRRRASLQVLLLRGRLDAIAPTRWLEELLHEVHGAHCATVRAGAHAVQFTDPDRVAQIVTQHSRSSPSDRVQRSISNVRDTWST